MKKIFGMILMSALIVNCGGSDDDDDEGSNFQLTGAGSGASLLAATPSVAKMSIYQFAVSANEDCSDPQVVIDNGDTAEEFDMLESPDLGSGTVPDGNYPCVIMVMSSSLVVAASETDGPCTADEEFSQSVCGSDDNEDGATVDLDGEQATCGGTRKAYLYLSTSSTLTSDYEESGACDDRFDEGDDTICNSFFPPSEDDTAQGIPLGDELVVSGDEVGVFTLSDLSVGEDGGDDSCGMGRPNFTFTSGS